MSEPDESDAGHKSPTAVHRPDDLGRLELRLMSFTVAVAQLTLLAPAWLSVYRGGSGREFYSGISLIIGNGETASPLVGLGVPLVIAYVVLVVISLVRAPTGSLGVLRALAGLVVTVLIMTTSNPDSSGETVADWTGAPAIALALWFIAMLIATVSPPTARNDRPR